MKVRKSREEISLSRLLARCQKMAGSSPDLSREWRLPTFLDSCDQMLSSLPKSPDPTAPSPEALLEYKNSLDLLRRLLPAKPDEEEDILKEADLPSPPPVPLPQGTTSRDTVSRQIYQRAVEKQQGSMREQLLGPAGGALIESSGLGVGRGNLDAILAEHKDQQERVAEEMIALTRSLKEQSAAAGDLIRKDTAKLAQTSEQVESNLVKLGEETKRVGEFSARGSCRCWIWLMMGLVVLTFIMMVMTMRLFRKKVPPPVVYESTTPAPPPTVSSTIRSEL